MREIVFDTETTGLSPLNGDRVVEIGCVEMFNRCETGRHFHSYFNPGRSMPPEAEAVHGLSDTFLSDKPPFHDVVEDLLTFIGEAPMIAHNAAFDFGFINHELGQCGRPGVCMSRMVDTLAIARQKFPGAKHSLDALCSRFGVDRSQRIKHGALLDAQLLAQVYVELTGGRQIGLGLVAELVEDAADMAAAEAVLTATPLVVRPARPHAPSEAELARHAAFVAKIKDPVWSRI
ncbi:DNA polymerase III subunit epsilon [Allosphingosinicella sp.]|uniref:DNA polymerase III subunit epsilon n=1 Tax=Allosphingosinicella sp. TaxID=2823234 RepID=UPI003784F788